MAAFCGAPHFPALGGNGKEKAEEMDALEGYGEDSRLDVDRQKPKKHGQNSEYLPPSPLIERRQLLVTTAMPLEPAF